MKKSRIIAAALAAVLLIGGAVIKICGADSNKELEPTLPLETKISKEQAVNLFSLVLHGIRCIWMLQRVIHNS